MTGENLAGGLLMLALGVFLVLRTVTHDSQHKNLVDRVLALG